jgi:hypothetical protein
MLEEAEAELIIIIIKRPQWRDSPEGKEKRLKKV